MRKGVLAFGIACGIVCAVCVALYLSIAKQEADVARDEAMRRYGGEQVEILVATKDIHPGETLDGSNSTVKLWLSDLLPEGCLKSVEEVRGKKAASLVMKGEAISQRRFEADSAELEIPEGCVALSVPAKDVQAVGGALSAGNLVDVYAIGSKTSRLGAGVLVLATNADTDESVKTSVSWVTLAVPVDQSQEYVTASQSMDIYFTLPSTSSDSQEEDGQDDSQRPDVAEQKKAASS